MTRLPSAIDDYGVTYGGQLPPVQGQMHRS